MANPLQDLQERNNWHWRNTMRPVRFFALDARAALPFCFLLIYARWITLSLALISTVIFWFLEKRGLTFDSAMRRFRRFLVGNNRPGKSAFRYRTLKDFG